MSDINISGFDELIDYMKKCEISEQKEKKALKEAGETFKKSFDENIAVDTGNAKRSIKNTTVRNSDGDLCQRVYVNAFYEMFDEFGTSKSKKNVGRIERAIDSVENEALEKATNILIK